MLFNVVLLRTPGERRYTDLEAGMTLKSVTPSRPPCCVRFSKAKERRLLHLVAAQCGPVLSNRIKLRRRIFIVRSREGIRAS